MTELFKDYDDYLNNQRDRARATSRETIKHRERRQFIYSKMLDCKVSGKSVLCVGCREKSEPEFFRSVGFPDVIGIDVYESPGVLLGDMSKMHLHPVLNKKIFDIIISIESIEHCLDTKGFLDGLNLLCNGYFVCMCPVVQKEYTWDCSRYPFMENLNGQQDLKEKLEKYFTEFNVVCSEIHKGGKRIFFILKKKGI